MLMGFWRVLKAARPCSLHVAAPTHTQTQTFSVVVSVRHRYQHVHTSNPRVTCPARHGKTAWPTFDGHRSTSSGKCTCTLRLPVQPLRLRFYVYLPRPTLLPAQTSVLPAPHLNRCCIGGQTCTTGNDVLIVILLYMKWMEGVNALLRPLPATKRFFQSRTRNGSILSPRVLHSAWTGSKQRSA